MPDSFFTSSSSAATVRPLSAVLESALEATPIGQTAGLSDADALRLLNLHHPDELTQLQQAANLARERQVGNQVYYAPGLSLFLTRLCELAPSLYPYPQQPGQEPAHQILTIDEIDARLEQAHYQQVRQVSLSSGGYWPTLEILGFEHRPLLKSHAKLLGYIHEKLPQAQLTGFSPDEIDFLAIISGKSISYILEMLQDHGLSILGGNGSELLVAELRHHISPRKASICRWFEIAHLASQHGLPIVAKLEASPWDTLAQRVQHLSRLRAFLQKHPHGFSQLAPQMWTNSPLTPPPPPTGKPHPVTPAVRPLDRFKLTAVSRLFLGPWLADQTVCWQPHGETEAQEGLHWGANGLGGTDALAYLHFLSGNASPQQDFSAPDFQQLIQSAQRTAVLRTPPAIS